MTVWLIGGTQESVELAKLLRNQFSCIVTVTTESARSLYADLVDLPTLQLWVGRLDPEQMPVFLQTYEVRCIVDASHPFAAAISSLAITTADQFQLPYLRYERPVVQATEASLVLDSFQTLMDGDYLTGQRVLLTIGYRALHQFRSWHRRATLFARILPSVSALEAALAAGFMPDRLIALRPPISFPLEKALWQQWQISMVVTKASGTAGGEAVKQQLAAELGIQLVIIDRPLVPYPQVTSAPQAVLAFCQTHG